MRLEHHLVGGYVRYISPYIIIIIIITCLHFAWPFEYQPRICKDGFISIVFDLCQVCRLFDRALVDTIGCFFEAGQRSNCAEERRP